MNCETDSSIFLSLSDSGAGISMLPDLYLSRIFTDRRDHPGGSRKFKVGDILLSQIEKAIIICPNLKQHLPMLFP